MSRFADDARALCRRAPNAKDVKYGAEEARGPVDIEDRVITDAGGERLGRFTIMTLAAGDLPALTKSVLPATVTVDGDTDYIVRDVQSVEDGELRELVMAEAT